MAMFPNANKGYMPFVAGQSSNKRGCSSRRPTKHGKNESRHHRLKSGKTYQVTLKDKNGFTYRYIVKTDGTKSMPVLCDSVISGLGSTDSLPTIGLSSPKRVLNSSMNLPFDSKDDGEKKEGIFSSLFRFLKEKTGKSKGGKSKRKTKPQPQRKRQRTVSAMSNLDPIQESPDEDDYIDDEDAESYAHDSSSVSESDNSENSSLNEAVVIQDSEVDSKKDNES